MEDIEDEEEELLLVHELLEDDNLEETGVSDIGELEAESDKLVHWSTAKLR